MYRLYILLKYYLFRVLHILILSFTNLITKSKKDLTGNSHPELEKKYTNLQKLQTNIFIKYNICATCEENCCCININRFDFNDCYVFDFPLNQGISEWYTISNLFKTFPQAIKYIIKKGKKDFQPDEYCDKLSETGCLLAAGKRPNYCTSYFCYRFVMEISKEDARLLSKLVNHDFMLQKKISFVLLKDIISIQFKKDTIGHTI